MNEHCKKDKVSKSILWFFENERGLFGLYVIAIIYLIFNTGIVSDEFTSIIGEKKYINFIESLIHGDKWVSKPVSRYLISIYYYFIDLNQYYFIDFLKIILNVSLFYMTTKFFSLYLNVSSSMLVTFLFIFFPTHDSTTYFYLASYLSISIGFYLYGYYLVRNDQFILAIMFALLASFTSYGSPPVAISLFVLCLLHKNYKGGAVLIIPNIIYSVYYIIITKVFNLGLQRLPSEFNALALIKQYALQVVTFGDAVIGASFVLKLYYSILENTVTSFLAAMLITFGVFIIPQLKNNEYEKKVKIDKKLLIILIILLFTSFGMFAATGFFPQLSFNLGNRTTIYGSLLFSYLLIATPIPDKARILIIFVMIISIMGISSHWKAFNKHQQRIINNIQMNPDLSFYQNDKTIYVTGNRYSKMGPFSNIEFLSENWVVGSIFKLALEKNLDAKVIDKFHKWDNGLLLNNKYNTTYSTGNYIYIYDSVLNQLIKLPSQEINNYIKQLPQTKRHWVQMIDNENINALILKLMPRLQYFY